VLRFCCTVIPAGRPIFTWRIARLRCSARSALQHLCLVPLDHLTPPFEALLQERFAHSALVSCHGLVEHAAARALARAAHDGRLRASCWAPPAAVFAACRTCDRESVDEDTTLSFKASGRGFATGTALPSASPVGRRPSLLIGPRVAGIVSKPR